MAGPLHQFQIQKIVPLEIAGADVSFTNSALWMVLGLATAFIFFGLSTRKAGVVPGRLQMASEVLYEFIGNMVRDNIGKKGYVYFPFIFSVFIFILLANLLGLIPGSFTPTSHIIVTAALGLTVFAGVTVFGLWNHGLHFFSIFCPPGVPLPLKFLIIPIEIFTFLFKPLTLAIRLFANMMAGHVMLKIFASFGPMLITLGFLGYAMSILPVVTNVAVYALELLVAILQAYIFAILSCIYLKDTVELHH
ncbi:MAG: F0F1 ATP synthase subunit A [Alphaproteobacteria bacterium]|nr:F0F1 ATP synthase subunit A [Alphaproteobacteria bacterium]